MCIDLVPNLGKFTAPYTKDKEYLFEIPPVRGKIKSNLITCFNFAN